MAPFEEFQIARQVLEEETAVALCALWCDVLALCWKSMEYGEALEVRKESLVAWYPHGASNMPLSGDLTFW
jgi:hypothetical protein